MFTGLNTPEDYLRVIKNHKWMIVLPILISLCLAWGVYLWLPKSYRASTLINFESQKVMHIQGVGESGQASDRPDAVASSRITAMKEVLYKRELLTQVAQEFHLYGYNKDAATPEFDDGVTGKMRGMVQFSTMEPPFLRVSFADPEPAVAKDVTNRLAELFVQENVKSREVIAASSTEFLQHELDAMKVQLEAKERAISQFKLTYLGQLPEQMGTNLNKIDRLETELSAQRDMERTLNLRLESVDKAIREYEDPTNE